MKGAFLKQKKIKMTLTIMNKFIWLLVKYKVLKIYQKLMLMTQKVWNKLSKTILLKNCSELWAKIALKMIWKWKIIVSNLKNIK